MTIGFSEPYWRWYGKKKKGAATQNLETIKEIPGTRRVRRTARETRHWGRIRLGGNQEGRRSWGRTLERRLCAGCPTRLPSAPSLWADGMKVAGVNWTVTVLLPGWVGEQKGSPLEQRSSGSEHFQGPQEQWTRGVMLLWNIDLKFLEKQQHHNNPSSTASNFFQKLAFLIKVKNQGWHWTLL